MTVVHILHEGRAICGTMGYPPSAWPEGHSWVSLDDCAGAEIADRCPACFDATLLALAHSHGRAGRASRRAAFVHSERIVEVPDLGPESAKQLGKIVASRMRAGFPGTEAMLARGFAIDHAAAVDVHIATGALKTRSPDDFTCPRCASKLIDVATPAEQTSTPGRIDRRECTRVGCDFWVSLPALERLNRPKPLPRVVHTIEHMPECPVRSTPAEQIPFDFGTAQKLVDAGCRCFATIQVSK